MTDTDWSEHYIKRGDPTKPTYYIIRPYYTGSGLFFNFVTTAGHIRYGLSKGWLPVVDMQNYNNAYLEPEKFGKENSWEYYFEQPLRIGLEQAYAGENVILSSQKSNVPYPDMVMPLYENRDNVLTEWRMLVKLALLKVKPALIQEIADARRAWRASARHRLRGDET